MLLNLSFISAFLNASLSHSSMFYKDQMFRRSHLNPLADIMKFCEVLLLQILLYNVYSTLRSPRLCIQYFTSQVLTYIIWRPQESCLKISVFIFFEEKRHFSYTELGTGGHSFRKYSAVLCPCNCFLYVLPVDAVKCSIIVKYCYFLQTSTAIP